MSLPRCLTSLLVLLAHCLAGPLFAGDLENELPGKVEMRPLWDGETLDGWEAVGGGEWTIVDGAIRGVSSADEKRHGHLITKQQFDDFVLSIEFRAVTGNSGLYFRVEQGNPHGVKGLQAEIDAVKDVGGLYETAGRGWVVQPTAEQVDQWFLPGEWNKLIVVATGGNVSVHVNGQKSAELRDDSGRAKGYIALQLHGGQEMDVWFRKIRIAELEEVSDEGSE